MKKTLLKIEECDSKKSPFQEDSESVNQKRNFLWQSNSEPFHNNQIKSWKPYDENNQTHLNLMY